MLEDPEEVSISAIDILRKDVSTFSRTTSSSHLLLTPDFPAEQYRQSERCKLLLQAVGRWRAEIESFFTGNPFYWREKRTTGQLTAPSSI